MACKGPQGCSETLAGATRRGRTVTHHYAVGCDFTGNVAGEACTEPHDGSRSRETASSSSTATGTSTASTSTRGALLGCVDLQLRSANTMLIDGDRIYVSDDRQVLAVDASGRILWRSAVPFNNSLSLSGLGVPGGTLVQPDFSRG